ncbi:alpha/beta hydrolase-fold protein [Bosea vestrisii]|uniref:alpha/beta hydrolase n=1 Tax=Bosea vestrisii TaxID=151416 RepID=UPI0024DF6CF0|nr:alpha/beta hydrolase-fold protein [Bosea vestrisii]WID95051.1 alpha/beta hydrolase-fold protein [Bosea vestrisii]
MVPALRPVELPHTHSLAFTSPGGAEYRLLVAIPPEPAPAAGFPVLVLVDGDALFATALSAARLQAGRTEVTGVGPAIILGVGYPGAAPFDAERRRQDLLPADGGAGRFLDLIAGEMLTQVETLAPIDRTRLSLVGHSFGGLFALHALFARPGLFRSHVAGSPSIWWNERAILATRQRFLDAPATSERAQLLITIGGEERAGDERRDPQRAARLRMARMVDNAAEMAQVLTASGRVDCEHVVFAGENHISVLPAMLSRAVAFALGGTQGKVSP